MNNFFKLFMITVLSVTILAACGSGGSGNADNLIDAGSATEGSWVGYNGDEVEDAEMVTSELIPYDPNTDYEINRSSYVSYFNGDEFIETKLYGEDLPLTIDSIEEADGIKVSFNQYNKDAIELVEK
ncbi:hypothetical protein [Salinicoccus halodurans]|uniref:DUF4825 domain-containing protein n=1 Tax=Salinicoccus halodurans TaxID=407035 RepID=A0AA94HBB7_9STAP|nr:hypothetical protein [Salinicoccus halodurans]SFK50426.1 hypothetical protein SAMN05216235_0012 [Salinicoccus halodurans]